MKNDGGPAFPRSAGYSAPDGRPEYSNGAQKGLSLRDYFAAAALQGLLACPSDATPNETWPTFLSELAYQYADAMLEARDNRP